MGIFPLNPGTTRLGSARASGAPMLGRTVTVGYGENELNFSPMDETNQANAPSEKSKKRKPNESLTISDEDDADQSFPHFLVAEATNHEPIKHSIFMIQKILQCAISTIKSAKKTEK